VFANSIIETRDTTLQKHANGSLHNGSDTGIQEEAANNVASLGKLANAVGETYGARRQKHANDTVQDNVKTGIREKVANNVASLGELANTVGETYEARLQRHINETLHASAKTRIEVKAAIAVIVILCFVCCYAFAGEKVKSLGRQQYLCEGQVMYEWEQDHSTIILYKKLPKGIGIHDIEVKIWPTHLKIVVHGKSPVLNGELFSFVQHTQTTWSVSGQGELSIRMKKAVEDVAWPHVTQENSLDQFEVHSTSGD